MKDFLNFLIDYARCAVKGGPRFYAWLVFLGFFILVGLFTVYRQFTEGLIVTGVTDQITWELYIANFVFMVGVAAAAVTVVFPSYIYKHRHLKDLYVIGEILALCAIPMCIMFIVFHMGRPDRLWHIIPGIGWFNVPNSMLDFDVIALNGYFFINLIGVFYYLFKKYTGRPINKRFYMPLIFLSIIWGPGIHIATAFILSTLAPVELWVTSAMPFRFLVTAFAAGPSLIIIILLILRKTTKLIINDKAIGLLVQIIVWCLGLTILMSVSEAVTELYASTGHAATFKYLLFGYNGLHRLTLWFWASQFLILVSFIALLFPAVRKGFRFTLPLVCAMVFAGIWIEKGIALVLPGFTPTPLGEYTEYYPTGIEIFNCLFVLAVGFFAYSLLLNGAVKIMTGEVRHSKARACDPRLAEIAEQETVT